MLVTPLDLGDWFASQALDGSLVLAIPIALVAGLVSFFSPCVVPLLPGYLSYATGLSGADLADARRGRMLIGSFLFVLGFSFVFVSFGVPSVRWPCQISSKPGDLRRLSNVDGGPPLRGPLFMTTTFGWMARMNCGEFDRSSPWCVV